MVGDSANSNALRGNSHKSTHNFNILVTKYYNILVVGMEKQQKLELGWRVSVLPILHFTVIHWVRVTHNCITWNAGIGNTDTLHPNFLFLLFLHLKYFGNFLLLVCMVLMCMRIF